MSDNYERYPTGQYEYCTTIGRLLTKIIGHIFKDLGFAVYLNREQRNGVDLQASDKENNLVFVAEIINWSPFSRMSEQRKQWIINNLLEYSCKRVFIYTTMKNEKILDDFSCYDISLLKIGYQVLPKDYYEHCAKKGELFQREPDCKLIRLNVRSKILSFLKSNGIMTSNFRDQIQEVII